MSLGFITVEVRVALMPLGDVTSHGSETGRRDEITVPLRRGLGRGIWLSARMLFLSNLLVPDRCFSHPFRHSLVWGGRAG